MAGTRPMTTWFTADWHLDHDNIRAHAERPFKNLDQMHEQLITRYRLVVQPDDEVWFLGDLTLRSPNSIRPVQRIVAGLPGRKHFVVGNHDCCKWDSYLKMGFVSFHSGLDVRLEGRQYHLVHAPTDAPPNTPRLICGHVHQNWKVRQQPCPTVNVGVDVWDFYPVPWESIRAMFGPMEIAR